MNNSEYENDDVEFTYDYDYNKEVVLDSNKGKSRKPIIIIIVLLLILIVILAFLFIKFSDKNKSETKKMVIVDEMVEIISGNQHQLQVNTVGIEDENPIFIFESSDVNVVTVNEIGIINAVNEGNAVVKVTYTDALNNIYSDECIVNVTKNDNTDINVNPNVDFQYSLPSSTNGWYKNNPVINLTFTNEEYIKNVKYATNCTNNCEYKDITGSNKIAVSGNGEKKITIVVVDKNDKEIKKDVSLKIDNTAPTIKLDISDTTIYTNEKKIAICAICNDTQSGCKENNVCKTYEKSAESDNLVAYDKVGNSSKSQTYKVVIDQIKPTCTLTYSDKKITATVTDKGGSGLVYYGFSSNYSGTNTKEKTDVTAGKHTYYVKDNSGNTNSCSITCSYTGWYKGTASEGNCYSRATAEKNGSTWARECIKDESGNITGYQGYVRYFECK